MSESLTKRGEEAMMALGFFVVGWSILEAVLEVAIAKQLKLSAVDGSIVTAGLQFKARATMLMGLLSRNPAKNADAIATLKTIMNRGDRNDLIHSVIGWDGDHLVFNRRKSDGALKVKRIYYGREELMKLCLEFSGLAEDLKSQLGISDRQHVTFLQRAHNAAAKAGKSPSPPKSSKTSRLSDSHSR